MRRFLVLALMAMLVPTIVAGGEKKDKRSRIYATDDMEWVYDRIVEKAESFKWVVQGDSEDRRGNIVIDFFRASSTTAKALIGKPDQAFQVRLERVGGGIKVSMTQPFFCSGGGSATWNNSFEHIDEALEMAGVAPTITK